MERSLLVRSTVFVQRSLTPDRCQLTSSYIVEQTPVTCACAFFATSESSPPRLTLISTFGHTSGNLADQLSSSVRPTTIALTAELNAQPTPTWTFDLAPRNSQASFRTSGAYRTVVSRPRTQPFHSKSHFTSRSASQVATSSYSPPHCTPSLVSNPQEQRCLSTPGMS